MDRFTKVIEEERVVNRHESHGVLDDKGREIGSQLVIERTVYDWAPEDQDWGYRHKPGTYYVTCLQATRNGEKFGAIPPTKHFGTIEEAEKHLAKSLKRSKARSLKQFGKPELHVTPMKEDSYGNRNYAIIPEGKLSPIEIDGVFLYDTREAAEEALRKYQKKCEDCGKPARRSEGGQDRYCDDCYARRAKEEARADSDNHQR